MHCPNDQTALVMSERSGIEIDYCPRCRGVWLDRGELDKIIERAGAAVPGASAAPQHRSPAPPAPPVWGESGRDDGRSYGYGEQRPPYDGGSYKRRKKENWLSELFD